MKPVEVEEKFKKTLREIEVSWATKTLKPNVLGFQIQPGTKWLPGLVPAKLEAYEARLGIMFPDDLRKSEMDFSKGATEVHQSSSSREPKAQVPDSSSNLAFEQKASQISKSSEVETDLLALQMFLEESDLAPS